MEKTAADENTGLKVYINKIQKTRSIYEGEQNVHEICCITCK